MADPASPAPIVHLTGVHVQRGTFRLEIPAWQLQPGSVVGLVGDNGAGKSTLLRLLPGLDPPDAGAVRVLGRAPWRDPVPVRQQLGYVAPDLPLVPARLDRLLRHVSGLYPTWDPDLANDLIRRFDLDLTKQATALSTGTAMRLRLLLALAFRPRLLVLDEPTTGLDLWARRTLLEAILDVIQDPTRTVIFAGHDLPDVERVCDRLVLMERGRITVDAPMSEVVPPGRTLEEVLLDRRGPE